MTITAAAMTAAAAAAVLVLPGCGQVNTALSKQWAVVNFRPDTTVATVTRVRQSCSHIPNLPPLPEADVSSDLQVRYAVRYITTRATGRDFAELHTCLQRFHAVNGVSILDVGGA